MNASLPTLGRTVHYRLTESDVAEIEARRAAGSRPTGSNLSAGNPVEAGRVCAAVITAVWGSGEGTTCNLQVFLDGTDSHWALSRSHSEEPKPGTWSWPPRN